MPTEILELTKKYSLYSSSWKTANWDEYLTIVESKDIENIKVFFDQGNLWIDMGNEGINHARFNLLFAMIFSFWFAKHSEQPFDLLGGCVIEKPNMRSAAPDHILYIGGNSPQWQAGEPRRINLDKWRVPDLVAEISETTLAIDLDAKKQLYAGLAIPEYWVINTKGKQVIAFILDGEGHYQETEFSQALQGLSIAFLEETLEHLDQGNNGDAGLWFWQKINQ